MNLLEFESLLTGVSSALRRDSRSLMEHQIRITPPTGYQVTFNSDRIPTRAFLVKLRRALGKGWTVQFFEATGVDYDIYVDFPETIFTERPDLLK